MTPLPTPPLRPRWHKVRSDLWSNKIRSLLVILSVAVGLFAIGMITTIRAILSVDMGDSYAASNPATVTITAQDFDDDTVDLAKHIEGVQDALGIRTFDIQAHANQDRWIRMNLKAVPDIDQMKIDKVTVLEGVWPPKDRELVIERTKRSEISTPLGGYVELQLPGGEIRQLKLVGIVHDDTVGAASLGGGYFMAPAQGYITSGTLEWLDQPDLYNTLYITSSSGQDDPVYLRELANLASNKIEDNGGLVYNANVRGMHDHPNASYTDAMSGVLVMLGGLVVFLSAFLITNTLSALLNQQAQQIAIMKTIGARSAQVISVYLALILVFGLLALALSLPLSQQAAYRLVLFLSDKINFTVQRYRVIPAAVALQTLIALLVPQVAGALPVYHGTRVKVQETLSGSLVENDPEHGSWIDRRLARVKRFSRPLLLSLRNTFRRKTRLALTLITLALGGAIFIATFNVRASLENYIAQLGRYFVADVNLTFDHPYKINEIQQVMRSVPGVSGVEGWAYAPSELLLDNDQTGEAVQLLGPPATTNLIDPMLISGRWVLPGDQNAIALSERFLSRFPGLKPGDHLRLRVNGKKTDWVVVGFFKLAGKSAGYLAYTGYDYLSGLINQTGQAPTYRVISSSAGLTIEEQRQLAANIQTYLQDRGFRVSETTAGKYIVENSADGLNTLYILLANDGTTDSAGGKHRADGHDEHERDGPYP